MWLGIGRNWDTGRYVRNFSISKTILILNDSATILSCNNANAYSLKEYGTSWLHSTLDGLVTQ